MAEHDGWEVGELTSPITVPAGTKVSIDGQWVPIWTWEQGSLPEGRAILEAELAAKLGNPRPTDLQTRWLRASADGPTKRRTHAVGTIESWADVCTYLELVTNDDLPMTLLMWQKGGAPISVVKVIPKAFTPMAELLWRLR